MGKPQVGLWNAFRVMAVVGGVLCLGSGVCLIAPGVDRAVNDGPSVAGAFVFGVFLIVLGVFSFFRFKSLTRSGPIEKP